MEVLEKTCRRFPTGLALHARSKHIIIINNNNVDAHQNLAVRPKEIDLPKQYIRHGLEFPGFEIQKITFFIASQDFAILFETEDVSSVIEEAAK